MDLFSLGCLLFFCITQGRHPFGDYLERDANIARNEFDLFLVEQIPEAVDLLSHLLDHNPEKRQECILSNVFKQIITLIFKVRKHCC